MQTRTPVAFSQAVLGTSATTLLTAANGIQTINSGSVTNTSANTVSLTVYLVPPAGSATDGTTAIALTPIGAGQTRQLTEIIGEHLAIGGTVQAKASAATSLTMTISSYLTVG